MGIPAMYKCPFCGRASKSLGFLKQHIRREHRTNIKCPACRFTAKTLTGLLFHCLAHAEDEKHKALYYLLHRNSRTTKVKVEYHIEKLKKYKELFRA